MSKRRRVILIITTGLFSICILTSIISALSNQNLPSGPEFADRLSELDKARLAEALHLKQELGALIWHGWDEAEIPVLLWTDEYSFLIGYPVYLRDGLWSKVMPLRDCPIPTNKRVSIRTSLYL